MTHLSVRRLAAALLILIVVVGILAGARQLARARSVQLFGTIVADVPMRDSVVALTFDDGPVAAKAGPVLDTLRAHGARATFFVTGRELAAAPAAGARIVAAGHELGNHSYSHQRMIFTRPSRIREELDVSDSLIRAAGQAGRILFRPPYGYKLITLPWVLSRTNRVSVTWSIEPDSYPGVATRPERIVAHVLERVHPGSIILLHVWYPSRATSLAAVGPLVDSLHARGYRVVGAGELIAASAVHRR